MQTVFLHIHKCGGSSIRHMLNDVYPYAYQYPVPIAASQKHEVYRTQPFTVPQVMQQITDKDLSEFKLFMGHYDWQFVQKLDKDAVVLTMLRNPVQQLYSMFRFFWVDTRNYGFYKDRYQSSGFEGFINERYVHQFTNHQTRFLSGYFYGHTENDLNNGVTTYAKKNIKRCVFGLMERWDESIALFEHAIGKKFPRSVVENFNGKYRATHLSDRVIEKATELQAYDMSLYDYALKHFEDQF